MYIKTKILLVKRKSGANPAQTRYCNRNESRWNPLRKREGSTHNGSEARRRRSRIGHGCLAIGLLVRKMNCACFMHSLFRVLNYG